jgi:hypothetical protein
VAGVEVPGVEEHHDVDLAHTFHGQFDVGLTIEKVVVEESAVAQRGATVVVVGVVRGMLVVDLARQVQQSEASRAVPVDDVAVGLAVDLVGVVGVDVDVVESSLGRMSVQLTQKQSFVEEHPNCQPSSCVVEVTLMAQWRLERWDGQEEEY